MSTKKPDYGQMMSGNTAFNRSSHNAPDFLEQHRTGAEPLNGAKNIPIGFVQLSPFEVRDAYDETAMLELQESIDSKGILQPIIVRRITNEQGRTAFEVLAGRRRYHAAKNLGLERIPAIEKNDVDDATAKAFSLIENLQRENLTMVEQGKIFAQLENTHNWTQKQIGKAVGKSQQHVSDCLVALDKSLMPPKPAPELIPPIVEPAYREIEAKVISEGFHEIPKSGTMIQGVSFLDSIETEKQRQRREKIEQEKQVKLRKQLIRDTLDNLIRIRDLLKIENAMVDPDFVGELLNQANDMTVLSSEIYDMAMMAIQRLTDSKPKMLA